jgi:hypothetical protein
LFRDYQFEPQQEDEVLQFMWDNKARLRELSMRMALKIADLVKISDNWRMLAESTVMKRA